jgi:diacylglycerol kinase (ATP)
MSKTRILKDSKRHFAIVCNPKSGKGKPLQLLPLVEKRMNESGCSFQTFSNELPASLAGFTDLIIMGGDGTINYTLNHFKKIEIPISLIRCGTGNDITQMLWGKQSFESTLNTALNGKLTPIDAGSCNNRIFLNGVGIGFDGWIVKNLLAKKLFTGKAAYYSTVISLLFFYHEQTVTIRWDGKAYTDSLFMFAAANGQTYGGGFRVAPKASLTDGLLEGIWVKKISLIKRLVYLPVLEKGKHLDKPLSFIHYQQSKQVTIESNIPLHAHLDGEHMMANHFEIKILPGYYTIRS